MTDSSRLGKEILKYRIDLTFLYSHKGTNHKYLLNIGNSLASLSYKCYKIFVIKEQVGHIYIMLMYANGKKFRKKGLPSPANKFSGLYGPLSRRRDAVFQYKFPLIFY